MKALLALVLLLASTSASAEPQTRLYDSRGNSVGTAVPQSDGTTRYYDARGNNLGTATTSPSGQTRFYDARGNVTGTMSAPPRQAAPSSPR